LTILESPINNVAAIKKWQVKSSTGEEAQVDNADKKVSIDLFNDKRLRNEISYEFGLKRAISKHNLPVVCCLVRDGAYWLPSFLDHYRKIGVEEFFFLDNGSSDETLKILKNEQGVGIYSAHASFFKHFNRGLRRFLIQIVRPEGWTIGVDIDELFDYPYSDEISLTQLCGYLDHFKYDSMSTHQLDMFPESPIDDLVVEEDNNLMITHPFYSLKGTKFDNYQSCMHVVFKGFPPSTVQLPNKNWKFYCDGLRFRKFGLGVWLTKHSLFKMGGRLVPYHHAHIHRNLRIANISGVLYHYKFTPYFGRQIETALRERQYFNNSVDYVYYSKTFNSSEKVVLKDNSSKRLKSVNELLDQSFLDAPGNFRAHFGHA